MATMTETPKAVTTARPSHDYHAEAHVLSGHLQRPIEQVIERHAPVKLSDRRGGHLTRIAEDVNIEGLIYFAKGKTRVSGSRSLKNNGWITLSDLHHGRPERFRDHHGRPLGFADIHRSFLR